MFIQKSLLIGLAASCMTFCTGLSYANDSAALELIHAQGCKGCHSLNGKGGTFGPALDGVGERLSRNQLLQKLVNPKSTNPASLMPASNHLSQQDLDLLISYMLRLRD